MSFSIELKKELSELTLKHGCCKKALAWGILLDAEYSPDSDQITFYLPDADIAENTRKLFSGVFGKSPVVTEQTVVGRKRYTLTQSSKTASGTLKQWDADPREAAQGLFLCPNCQMAFLRGALIGCAVINDPAKEAHLEFRLKHPSRASVLYPVLAECEEPPKLTNRQSSCGLYYKKGAIIEDILLQCGAQQAGFSFINDKIEKEIRNTENRVTNCEARNIQKTVSASHRQITAIRHLKSKPALWDSLPEELRITAELRMEHENASLQELIRLHNPPISKSGLNHRLSKLMQLAREEL